MEMVQNFQNYKKANYENIYYKYIKEFKKVYELINCLNFIINKTKDYLH